MGAYTWTYVKIDKLTPQMVETCVSHAKQTAEGSTYGRYSKKTWDSALKDWLNLHKKNYDYFVNECGVNPKKMTDEYLTRQLKRKMKDYKLKIECYDKCLVGEMSIEEVLRKTHQLSGYCNDFLVIKRKGNYYVNIKYEIFRNYEYCEEEFHTVEGLIKHLEKPESIHICDLTDKMEDSVQPEYGPLSESLKKKIINYYNAIGDGNFVVHFG